MLYFAHASLSKRDQPAHQLDKTPSGSKETRRDYSSYVRSLMSLKVISRGIRSQLGTEHLLRVLGKKGLARGFK